MVCEPTPGRQRDPERVQRRMLTGRFVMISLSFIQITMDLCRFRQGNVVNHLGEHIVVIKR